jgi:endonuclease/exonuclease/phosphatase family metal-dependent hydrolase
MRRIVTITGWILGVTVILIILAAIVFLLYLTFSGYHPKPVEEVEVKGPAGKAIGNDSIFTIMTWNIGYAGLGKEMDFFYEGGKRVRPEKDEFRNYLDGILQLVKSNDSIDFIHIQEADIGSKRSYHADEPLMLSQALKDHCFAFARNYDSKYVPVPAYGPMGKVLSGIVSFSKYKPVNAIRVDFGTRFYWPKQLAMLQRCFMVLRFPLRGGKELVMINTHNSVFDEEGTLRKKELTKLNEFAADEYRKGNFVVIGGDWNQNPRGFEIGTFINGDISRKIDVSFGENIFNGWKFVFDPERPSNRDVDRNYRKGITRTTIIDFFVISPNIEAESVKTIPTGFKNSDHQPVIMKFRIIQ